MKGPEIDGGLEGLGDLAQRGSSAAADALADLIGCRILRCAPAFHPPEDFRGRLEWDSGVFCDVGGAFAGAAAVFLCSGGQSRVVEALCGSRAPSGEFAASALSEFGNMLTSRALSAIGDGVGALLLPGLPELANSGAGAFFQDRLGAGAENADTLCVESELFEETGALRVLLVLAFHEPSKLLLGGYPDAGCRISNSGRNP